LIFCLDDLSIDDSGVLKSPTTTVLELIYAFRSFRVCLMKLGAYRLIIIISFWSISPFFRMECPSLSHLINVSSKSSLSESKYCYSCLAYVSCSPTLKLPPLYHTACLLFLIKSLTSCTSRDINLSKTIPML
jgi:hypothetical protein